MQEAGAETLLGDFDDAVFTQDGVTTRFFRRGERFFVEAEGPGGAPAEYEVAYAFGVDPLQQVLLRLPGGRLQALAVAWDARPAAAGGQRWMSLYPGERIPPGDALHWTGPNLNWNSMCAECHSTGLEKRYSPADDAYDTRWAELDVACEACHGPGSAHVAWAEAGGEGGDAGLPVSFADDGGAWVFEPGAAIARRVPARAARPEIDACGRCHARRSPIAAPYVFGRPLLDTHRLALLDEALYHPDGQVRDEVYEIGSFLQSRMYAAGVTCSDCHDPHAPSVAGDPDALCSGCHRPQAFAAPAHHGHEPGSAGASCVACHMPASVFMQVDSRRDHSFRLPRPDLALALGTPDACSACHADRGAAWAAAAWRERWGEPPPHFGPVLAAGRTGAPRAARDLARLVDDEATPAIVRASALRLLASLPDAAVVGTLESAAGDPDALVRAAALEAAEWLEPVAKLRLARPLLRDPVRGVRIGAARLLAALPREELAPGDQAPVSAALREWREAQMVNAERPDAHLNLGVLHAELGELARARKEYETALRLAPWFVPAWVNLADVHRLEGRHEESVRVLREGLAKAPETADLRHALGLALVRAERTDEALAELARAAELDPGEPSHAYVYGVGLHQRGESERAVAVLEAAHARHPGDRAVLFALATIERDRGRAEAARGWAQALARLTPEDPAVQEILRQVGGAQPH
jgi:tetratricopeptide (TPR) repeat protein